MDKVIILLLIASVMSFLIFIKMDKLLKISLIIHMLFMSLSVMNIYNLNYSPRYSILFILSCIVFFIFGYLIYEKIQLNLNIRHSNVGIEISFEKYITLTSVIIIPLLSFYAFKAISIYTGDVFVYNYRRMLFESGGELLFDYKIIFPIFELFIGGSIQIILIMSLCLFFFEGKKRFLLISILAILLYSVIYLGRFSIYRFILLFFLLYFVRDKYKVGKLLPILVCSVFSIVLISFSLFRGGVESVFYILLKYVIGYNTFSFNLFERYMSNADLINENSTLGVATLGSLAYFISLPFTWFTKYVTYMQSQSFLFQDDFIWLGVMDNLPIEANAFYTIYQEVYFDFGIISIPIFFFIGIFYSWVIFNARSGNKLFVFMSVYLSSLFIFGNLKNPLVMHSFVLPIFLFFMAFISMFFKRISR